MKDEKADHEGLARADDPGSPARTLKRAGFPYFSKAAFQRMPIRIRLRPLG